MKGHKLLLFCFFILITGSEQSCKKKLNNSPANYKLATIDLTHSTSVAHYCIVYDAYNNVDSMIIIGGGTDTGHTDTRIFNYFGGSYTVSDQNGNSITVQTSTNGLILGVFMFADTLTMVYNGTQVGKVDTKVPSSVYPYYAKTDTNYLWNNGDMVSISFNAGADSCDYNLSKAGQIGDAFRIDAFLAYGRPYIKTSHTPIDLKKSGVWLEKYFYQFDGQGRITEFVKVRNNNGVVADDSTFYVYQYYAF